MVNFMELMSNEGLNLLKGEKKTRKNYSKIYFQSCSSVIKKIESELDLSDFNQELKQRYEIQKKINECSIELIEKRDKQNKSIKFKSLKDIVDSIYNKKYKWLQDTLIIIKELEQKYENLYQEKEE